MFAVRKKISRKLFAALFLVAVIPISVMGFGMYRAAENTLMNSAFMHIRTVAQDNAGKLDTWYRERLNDIKVLSGLPSIRDLCFAACDPRPKEMQAARSGMAENSLALTRGKSPAYQSIHVLTPSGGVLASTEADSEMLVSKKYMDDLKRLMSSEGPVLSPLHQHSDREWYIHLTVPIYSEDGKISAAIFAILDALGTIDPLLADRTGLGNTGEAYLVNQEGKIVTQSRFLSLEQTGQSLYKTAGIISALDKKDGISIYRNYMGREVIGSYTWLPRYHSALMVEMETDEILSPLRGIKVAVLMTAAMVSLVCILIALLLSRQISRPIIQVAEASRRLSAGELEQHISYSGKDEIGTLSESFNSMAEKLSRLIESLKQKEASLKRAYDELLHTQVRLIQSEKMAAIGELVTSVVHEMRNPLSSVKLNYQIIGRTLEKEGPIREHHSIGLNQIAQLEKMFCSLLDYSKPISLKMAPFRIDTLVKESLCQLAPHCEEGAVELKGIDDSLPSVIGDPEKMQQVIVNVVKNALEAAGAGARIIISAVAAKTDSEKEVILDIKDNGPGISQQDLKRIFQPFFTTKQKGTGLGLSIVKKIMEAHGFAMTVLSDEGAGTVVSLHLKST